MFGAKPQEKVTQEEVAEFEAYAAKDLQKRLVRAAWATAVFVGTLLVITPFSSGHTPHMYWESFGRYLVILVMGELLWLVLWWGPSMGLMAERTRGSAEK